jgi:MerR family transcriptional regulator/heat shock protein HspR
MPYRRFQKPMRPTRTATHELAQHIDTIRINAYTSCVASSYGGDMAGSDEIYFISMVARELGMHPQTLRKYERLGFVQPTRTIGSMRVYSREEIARLRLIKHLVDELGINLAGVQRLLSAADVVQRMRELAREEAVERAETRRRLARDLDHLSEILGL